MKVPTKTGILRTVAAELGRKLHKYDKKALRLGYLGTADADRDILRKWHLTRFKPQSFPGPFEHRMARDLTFSSGVHAAGRNSNFRELVKSWESEKGPANMPGLKQRQNESNKGKGKGFAFPKRALPKAAPKYHAKAKAAQDEWTAQGWSSGWSTSEQWQPAPSWMLGGSFGGDETS